MLPHARSFGAERRRVPESSGMATRTGGLLRVECALLRRTIDERAAHKDRADQGGLVIGLDGLEPELSIQRDGPVIEGRVSSLISR